MWLFIHLCLSKVVWSVLLRSNMASNAEAAFWHLQQHGVTRVSSGSTSVGGRGRWATLTVELVDIKLHTSLYRSGTSLSTGGISQWRQSSHGVRLTFLDRCALRRRYPINTLAYGVGRLPQPTARVHNLSEPPADLSRSWYAVTKFYWA